MAQSHSHDGMLYKEGVVSSQNNIIQLYLNKGC